MVEKGVMQLLGEVQEQQSKVIEMLTTITAKQDSIDTRLDVLEKDHAQRACKPSKEQIQAEKQKAWIPVVLKLLEIVSIIVGVALGVNVLN